MKGWQAWSWSVWWESVMWDEGNDLWRDDRRGVDQCGGSQWCEIREMIYEGMTGVELISVVGVSDVRWGKWFMKGWQAWSWSVWWESVMWDREMIYEGTTGVELISVVGVSDVRRGKWFMKGWQAWSSSVWWESVMWDEGNDLWRDDRRGVDQCGGSQWCEMREMIYEGMTGVELISVVGVSDVRWGKWFMKGWQAWSWSVWWESVMWDEGNDLWRDDRRGVDQCGGSQWCEMREMIYEGMTGVELISVVGVSDVRWGKWFMKGWQAWSWSVWWESVMWDEGNDLWRDDRRGVDQCGGSQWCEMREMIYEGMTGVELIRVVGVSDVRWGSRFLTNVTISILCVITWGKLEYIIYNIYT